MPSLCTTGTADVEKAVIGETVKIKADSREGYVFDRWEVNYGDVVVDDKNAEETTFYHARQHGRADCKI